MIWFFPSVLGRGLLIFNKHSTIEICGDKTKMFQRLRFINEYRPIKEYKPRKGSRKTIRNIPGLWFTR
jgi:hypothetical protein